MPTGISRALIPVRETTKERLARRKGRASYDELLNALLDCAPPAAVHARLYEPVDANAALPPGTRPARRPLS